MNLDLKTIVADQTQFPPLSNFSITTEQIQALLANVPKISITPELIATPAGIKQLEQHAQEVTRVAKQVGIDINQFAAPHFSDPLSLRSSNLTDFIPKPIDTQSPAYDVGELQRSLNEDKERANKIIQQLVEAAKETKRAALGHLEDRPLHPYEQMIYDYLGKNFKPKSVEDIEINSDINLFDTLKLLESISKKLFDKAMAQTRLIAKQAFDTSFPGITSEALGTAFATLTSNSNGEPDFVMDHEGIKRHLTFVENVRNIPVDYIVSQPHEALKKIISEFYKAEYCF